ncbi:MAG: DEAD/DEAH box helicase [Enterobacterales bacterium]|nr:DEAD/DEAH box helicase [Enterobacterales bacterium]
MLKFSRNDIKNEFDTGSFSRGERYFKQGLVGDIIVNEESNHSIELYSEVDGRYPYCQTITVEKASWGIAVEGNCSCPVGFNCKHVVATLLDYLSTRPKDVNIGPLRGGNTAKKSYASTAIIDGWLGDIASEGQLVNEQYVENNKKWIAYILEPGQQKGELRVTLHSSGFRVKGGYLKAKPLSFSSQTDSVQYNYSKNAFHNSIDKEIIMLLKVSQNNEFDHRYYYQYQDAIVEGEFGWQALLKMIKTRRCFWRHMDGGFLTLGADIDLSFEWQSKNTKDGEVHQLVTTQLASSYLVFTEPPCEINPSQSEINAIKSKLKNQQLSRLIESPIISDLDIKKFNLNMIKTGLDQQIPLPIETKITDIDGSSLKPKLTICRLVDPLEIYPPLNALKISFVYKEIEIQALEQAIIIFEKKDEVLRIKRDMEKEIELSESLLDLNFELNPPGLYASVSENQLLARMSLGNNPTDTISRWRHFMDKDRQELANAGWLIEIDPSFSLDFIIPDDEWNIDIEEENDWFSLKFDIKFNDLSSADSTESKLSLMPIIADLLNQYDILNLPDELLIEHTPYQYIVLPKDKIKPILDLIYELFDSVPLGDEVFKISKFDALLVNQLDKNDSLNIQWSGDLRLKELGKKLANFDGIKTVQPPKLFKGDLREYQSKGFNWLQFLREFEFSGILADDMGLGKTVQTLIHLQKEKSARRIKQPCLIIAPTSLMSNWKKEAKRFTPNLKVHISQGSDRRQHFSRLGEFDVILTTYSLIVRDFEILKAINYYFIILDEAQNIKNPRAKATKGIKAFNSQHRLALTGTPMENHLGELWSIYDFLMPGFLSTEKGFNQKYRNPIEKDNNPLVSKMLANRVSPFLLRRSKQVVANELPPKTEIIKTVSFSEQQSILYETIRITMEKKIQQAIATKGLNRSHITILDALLKLRQVCCDPQLVKLEQAKKVKRSAKLELLIDMVLELVEEGRKILIFSQFTSMLSIIEKSIKAEKISYTKLTGSTRKRDQVIEKFSSGQADVFLISLKAGGVGLNLTTADTVIHYDPWWNPAVENQASDRAHRIGQDKPVFVYKLVVENTLEEKILDMQAKKQALADGIYGDKKAKDASKLTADDIKELLGIASDKNH